MKELIEKINNEFNMNLSKLEKKCDECEDRESLSKVIKETTVLLINYVTSISETLLNKLKED